MSKIITIKAPSNDGGTMDITGKVAWLNLGDKKHKFFINELPCGEKFLSDFKSGRKLKSLTPTKIVLSRSYQVVTDRYAAMMTLEYLVNKHGLSRVKQVIDEAEKLN